jgi:hypothetical protein
VCLGLLDDGQTMHTRARDSFQTQDTLSFYIYIQSDAPYLTVYAFYIYAELPKSEFCFLELAKSGYMQTT